MKDYERTECRERGVPNSPIWSDGPRVPSCRVLFVFKVKFENIQFMTVIESPCNVCTVWHTGESNTLGGDSNLKSEMNLRVTILNG